MKRCEFCRAVDGAGTPAMVKKCGDKVKPLTSKEVQAMRDAGMTKTFNGTANHKDG